MHTVGVPAVAYRFAKIVKIVSYVARRMYVDVCLSEAIQTLNNTATEYNIKSKLQSEFRTNISVSQHTDM